MNLISYSLSKNLVITGSKLLELIFVCVVVITWSLIIVWILLNGGHISSTDSFQSILNLKTKESIETNFTEKDFETNYVKPEEFQYYNRIWDSEDISFEFPEEIQIMTNLIITANQTQSSCPESPLMSGALCEPERNHCKRGRKMKHGIQTGKCVQGDFKYWRYLNKTKHWKFGYDCEVRGWCPVERIWPPLRGFGAVMIDTQESTLWVKNTITFDSYNIVFDNQPNTDISYYLNCKYDPKNDSTCPIFKLKDILKYSENNNESYAVMARSGAVIDMKIVWNCFLPPFRAFNSTKDCELKYSFHRIDNEKSLPTTGYTTYRQIFYYNNGKTRTFWKSYRLRILVDVKASLSRYNLFRFVSLIVGYNGIYSLVLWVFGKQVKTFLIRIGHKVDDFLNISPKQEIRGQTNRDNSVSETPLILDENEPSFYETPTERQLIEIRPPLDQLMNSII